MIKNMKIEIEVKKFFLSDLKEEQETYPLRLFHGKEKWTNWYKILLRVITVILNKI